MKHLSTEIKELETYLRTRGWLKADEAIRQVEKPGDGNMNFTLRIDTGSRTFIIKQSREYVEKYPQVAAPPERVLNEARFYDILDANSRLSAMTPNVIGLDTDNSVMVMEDLGAGSDYSRLYRHNEKLECADLHTIIDFAADLHQAFPVEKVAEPIRNRKMRELNHAHIFELPYVANNGHNLDEILPGLQAIAEPLKQDTQLHAAIQKLGAQYLADGPVLLHGDYFPGSWLKTANGIKIIDPEFCFFGFPEFEIGVLCAHLKFAQQPPELITETLSHYSSRAPLDTVLTEKYSAVEVLRRIIGLAQLPLEMDLEKRRTLTEEAKEILTT